MSWTIGLDVGGTKVMGGLVSPEGVVEEVLRLHTPVEEGAEGVLRTLVEAARQLQQAGGSAVHGIGVSTAGHVDWETGRVLGGTPNMPGWAGTAVAEVLGAATGLPVCADNDGNAAAWGEAWLGAGRGCRTVVAVTLGTGFGAGIVDAGHVLRGARGGGAELGHLILVPDGHPCNCGQAGCVEAYVSGTALGRAARSLWGEGADAHELFDRAGRGETVAQEVLATFSRHLALVLLSIFNLADPEAILVGGGLSARADQYMPAVRARLDFLLAGRRWQSDQVRVAELGDRAGMIGAAGQAWTRFGPSRA